MSRFFPFLIQVSCPYYSLSTGVHASVLCTVGTVEIVQWEKHGEEFGDTWGHMVASLDPESDVILFPAPGSTPAQQMDWTERSYSGEDSNASKHRMRLVVLEASWSHGKTMYSFISQYRQAQGLVPLRCVALEDIVGQYWRFHEEGNSAVSTIEAIAHTAEAAGSSSRTLQDLTVLFQLQRYRVLSSVAGSGSSVLGVSGGEGRGNGEIGAERIKKPRAVAVRGSPGCGDWGQVPGYYDLSEEISFSSNETEDVR
jgi:DTW domain-containing protein YfiP